MTIRVKEIPLTGKLRTSDDPTTIDNKDFCKLDNMRYGDLAPKAVYGQTRINTTAISSNPKIKSGIHFVRDHPTPQSNVLVAAHDSGDANQKVFRNVTDIPDAGNFDTASPLFTATDATSSVGKPRFNVGPNGSLIMCNGKDTAIWYGEESPIGGFLDWDSDGDTYKYDHWKKLSNRLTGENAILQVRTDSETDSNTMLLLHLDGNLSDAASRHVPTMATTQHYDSQIYVSGTNSIVLGGSDEIVVSDSLTDFSFSSGDFTIDFYAYKPYAASSLPAGTYYYQGTSTDHIKIYVSGYYLYFVLRESNVDVVTLSAEVRWAAPMTYPPTPIAAAWTHVGITGRAAGTDVAYRLFVGGMQQDYLLDSHEPQSYSGNVYIGSGNATNYVTTHLDQFRVSNTYRWSSDFIPPILAAGQSRMATCFIASPLPAEAFNFYVVSGSENSGGGGMVIYRWGGDLGWVRSNWQQAYDINGTSINNYYPLSHTFEKHTFGSLTEANLYSIDGVISYWYKIEIYGLDDNVSLYHVSVDSPMQQLKELWDGVLKPADAFFSYDASTLTYRDWTAQVFSTDYDDQNTGTFAEIDNLSTSDYLLVGSLEQLMSIDISIPGGHENTNVSRASVYTWDGTGWVFRASTDLTSSNDKSLGKSGSFFWVPPDKSSEYQTTIAGTSKRDDLEKAQAAVNPRHSIYQSKPGYYEAKLSALETTYGKVNNLSRSLLYYYKIVFNAALSNDVQIYSVKVVPAPIDCRGYRFSMTHDDSLFLCGNVDSEPNSAIYSAKWRPQMFNGEEAGVLPIGDNQEIIAGVSFANQFGATMHKIALICKKSQTFKIIGDAPYEVHPVSFVDGCLSPETMAVGEVEIAQGFRRQVAVWLSQRGIVACDGGSGIQELSNDIRDKFDPNHANYLGDDNLANSYGRLDPAKNEYHFVAGNYELVLDFKRMKWFTINRGPGARLNGMFQVYDSAGISQMYGFDDNGTVYRLENGTSFEAYDGSENGIACAIRLPDVCPVQNMVTQETWFQGFKLVQRAKNETSNNVTVLYYPDSQEESPITLTAFSPNGDSGKRLKDWVEKKRWKLSVFHGLEFRLTTDDETIGFEPLQVAFYYDTDRQDIRG